MALSFLPTKGRVQVSLLRLVSLLPLSAGRLLGRALGRLLSYTNNYTTRVTRENIAQCFAHLDKRQQQALVQASLEHTGMLSIEMAMVWCKPPQWLNERIVDVKGKHLFDAELNKGKGLIVLAPHLGNWEALGQYLAKHASIMNMYTPPKVAEMDALIANSRTKTGAQVAPANQRGLVMLLKHLKAGHAIGILPDQVPDDKERGSLIAPFFDRPAQTMRLVSQMLKKTQCRAIGAVAKRVDGGFEIAFTQVPDELYSDDEVTSVTALNQLVQTLVEASPAQYQWEYRRFKGVTNKKKKPSNT